MPKNGQPLIQKPKIDGYKETLPDRLLGDEHRFKQVLVNLTKNALKFTTQGAI